MSDHPGLIKRKLIKEVTPSTVEIEETWDLSVPGCPLVAVDLSTGHVNKEATTVRRRMLLDKRQWNFGDD